MALKTKTIAQAYKDLLVLNNSNGGLSSSGTTILDGNGNSSSVVLGKDRFHVRPSSAESTAVFQVKAKDGTTLFYVDSTNKEVRSGTSETIINTQTHQFGLYDFSSTSNAHHMMMASPMFATASSFSMDGGENLGTDAAPDTSKTISADAHEWIPFIFKPEANIIVQSGSIIISTEGDASSVTSNIMRYDFDEGSSSTAGDLTNGSLVLTNLAIEPNDDRIAHYDYTLIAGNKELSTSQCLVACIRQPTTTYDITCTATIKYHFK